MLGRGKKDLIQLAAGPPLLAQRSLELDCSGKGLGESKEQTGCLLQVWVVGGYGVWNCSEIRARCQAEVNWE